MSLLDKFQTLRLLDKSECPLDQTRHRVLRDEIVLNQLILVSAMAQFFLRRCPSLSVGNDLDDLTSEGTVGLMKAVDRFDPDQGVKFATYAAPFILGEMQRYVRDRAGAGTQTLPLDFDGSADPLEIAAPDTGADAERRSDIRAALEAGFVAVESELTTDRARAAWKRARIALELRFFEGKTPDEIGAAFGISKSGACNLIARAQELLKPHLEVLLFA